MARYRKKPVVIEAFQWTGERDQEETPTWLIAALQKEEWGEGAVRMVVDEMFTMEIFALGGAVIAQPGDFIVRGILGELYPCKPDIFAETYEPATPETGEG